MIIEECEIDSAFEQNNSIAIPEVCSLDETEAIVIREVENVSVSIKASYSRVKETTVTTPESQVREMTVTTSNSDSVSEGKNGDTAKPGCVTSDNGKRESVCEGGRMNNTRYVITQKANQFCQITPCWWMNKKAFCPILVIPKRIMALIRFLLITVTDNYKLIVNPHCILTQYPQQGLHLLKYLKKYLIYSRNLGYMRTKVFFFKRYNCTFTIAY